MCCLQYEQNVYDEMLKIVPTKGSLVEHDGKRGVVIDAFVIKGIIKVKFGEDDDAVIKVIEAKDVKILKKAKIETKVDTDADGDVSELIDKE